MKGIKEFFQRIQNARAGEVLLRSVIRDAFKKKANVDIPVGDMSFSAGALVVKNISQAARNEVYIKKSSILEMINSAQKKRVITDIKFG